MSVQKNVQIVKDTFAAFGRGDMQGVLALLADDIEWITPGERLPFAGTHRGQAGVADFFQKISEMFEISFLETREFWFWSSASTGEESKPRIGRSRDIGSSPLPFEMAK
jgi:ketosteroid isomerase-like protein